MRVLVSGGAGFIGSHTAEELLRRGHEVVVLDNFSTGKRDNIDDMMSALAREGIRPGHKFRLVEGDVRDPNAVRECLDRVAGIIHLAAIPAVPRSLEDPAETSCVNYIGTINILEEGRRAGVKRFVCASSSAVYGNTPCLPKSEDMTPQPLSPYAVGKYACEIFGKIFVGLYPDLNIVFLRYFNVFGPRQDPSSGYAAVIPAFISNILRNEPPVVFGDGHQTRDFTFVKDAVQATLLSLEMGQGFAVYNVARDSQTTLLELLEVIYQLAGKKIEPVFTEPRPGDVLHSRASLERIGREIGYVPRYSLEEGLELTVRWYEERLQNG
ncbi:MAG: NAD-dependent epimerase/dehydratase family protein [candidate division WOR-3 bacterium]